MTEVRKERIAKQEDIPSCDHAPLCLARRDLLIAGAAGTAATVVGALPLAAHGRMGYPRKKVIRLSELKEGEPVAFNYPLEAQPNFIVKLGTPAQGGIGPDQDVVAFSALCTHMGGSLRGRYQHASKAIGPCPFHFSTFDLTKSGSPVHASATENLPQVVLKATGDDVFAVGVNGLVYGYRDNLADGTLAEGATPREPFESNG